MKNSRANKIKSLFVVLFSVLVVYLVFFLKIDLTRYRSVQQIWNLGHIFLFIGLSYLAIKTVFKHSSFSVYMQFVLISSSAVLLGILIEYLQTFTGRDKSSYDVLLDWVGACIGFVVFSDTLLNMNRLVRINFRAGVVILTILSLIPMLNIIIDDIHQGKEFPVLVSNENTRELSRFQRNNVSLSFVSNSKNNSGLKSLRIDFSPGQYPTASLGYFNQNWSGYNYLSFDVFSPISVSTLVIRIHDQRHERSGYQYRDRFNHSIQLSSGWNKIKIPLTAVKKAPFKRDMNMQKIQKLMFFQVNLRKPLYLLFSTIKLEK